MSACVLCCALGVARAEPPISVVGNRHIDSELIRSHFHADKDGSFHPENLDAALKSLYATHLFSDVKIRRLDTGIQVQVAENPLVEHVAVEGNKAIKDKDLKGILKSKENAPLSSAVVHDDVELMLEFYRRHGRFSAHIDPKTINNKNGTVSLVYEISEGARTGVKHIHFTGNHAFGAQKLNSIIKTGKTNVLSFLLDNDFYDPEKVEGDRELLLKFYRAHGYPDARVGPVQPQYDKTKNELTVTFAIAEGALYRFGNVAVKSELRDVRGAELESLLVTRGGNVYNSEAIDKTTEAILVKLARRGQPFAAVRPEIERVAGQPIVNLAYHVQQGPRIYVERIEIHGNKKTRDNVVRRELTFGEGSPYNPALVQLSERHLKKLGFFKTVKFERRAGSTSDRTVVDVQVEEEDTGQFSIAGGYSDVDGAVANVTLGDRNLFGRGQSASLSLDYGQYVKGFDLTFTEPYFLGQKVALGLELFARESDSNSNQSYTSTVYGGKIGFNAPMTDEIGLNLHYGLSNQSLALDPTRGIASIPVQQAAAAGPQWVSYIGLTGTFDTRDDARHPSSGTFASATNDVAGLGGDVRFLRSTDDIKHYEPLTEDIVSVTHAQSGYIVPWGGQTLPLLNGFFGGPQLVRGFAVNGFGPRDVTPGTTMDNIGGNAYWATSQEIQAPLPGIPPEFKLKGAVFADAGSLWGNAANYGPALSQSLQVNNSRAVRSSVGAGLVWDSILGPLRVDYAYPLTKGPVDVTQRLHFGFGMF